MSWNYRLLKDRAKDVKGNIYERIRIVECYYMKDKVTPSAFADVFKTDKDDSHNGALIAFGEYEDDDVKYLPIDDKEALTSLEWRLTHMLLALSRPILTLKDFDLEEEV